MAKAETERECVRCGKVFTLNVRPQSPGATTCSNACRQAVWYAQAKQAFTGRCLKCGKDGMKFPHLYCSRVCRDTKPRTRPPYVGTFICAFCGKETERPQNDARRQTYCSKACRQRDNAPDTAIPEVDANWLAWFSGLTDGEGCFFLSANEHHAQARFSISLRRDDRPVLENIQATLGFGHIHDATPNQIKRDGSGEKVNPKSVFFCHSTKECRVLAMLLRRTGLRSKKARDFALWAEAVARMCSGETDHRVFMELSAQIKRIRQYPAP